jgi:HPt (histidine-containing phosphotransfer) domain-containing protein
VSLDDDRMAALRQRFIAAAAGQADEIEALLRQGELEGVRHLAHGLAGRSGMFGFVELGEAARRLDEAEAAFVALHAEELLRKLRRVTQEG